MAEQRAAPWGSLSGPFVWLALISALLWPRGSDVAPARPSAVAPVVSSTEAAVAVDLEGLLADVWGCTVEACGRERALEVVHVSVPDPIDSRSGWLFDDSIDAIQRAVEATGRTLVSFELPWRAGGTRHRERPGALVFTGDRQPTLLVLLVGELPTTGIHPAALHAALAFEARWWAKVGRAPRELRFLMPAFSGSIGSLERVLREADTSGVLPAGARLRLVTGSATSLPARPFGGAIRDHAVDFSATVRADDQALATLLSTIAAQDWRNDLADTDSPRVAVLIEGNTGYGAKVGAALDRAGVPATVLPFPLHISRLRSLYDREAPADLRAERQSAKLADNLRLPLSDDGVYADTPPALSADLSARSAELVLANLLTAIYRENVRYLGIFATDTRDKLFLATQIRRYCPDVRLFTLEADVLFTHPDYSAYLEGMWVASSYAPPGQTGLFRHGAGSRRLEFSGTNVQGAYNATLALLDAPGELFEGYLPDPRSPTRARPLLWISEVARGSFWPRAVVDPTSGAGGELPVHTITATAAAPLVPRSAPSSSSLLLWVFSVLLALHVDAYWRARSRASEVLGLAEDATPPRWAVATLLGVMTTVAAVLTSTWLLPQLALAPRVDERLGRWALALALVAGLVTTTIAAVDAVITRGEVPLRQGPLTARVRAWVEAQAWRPPLVGALAVLGALIVLRALPALLSLVTGVLWSTETGAVAGAELVFFHHRATRVLGGLSPLMPLTLLAAGLYLGALYTIRERALCADGVIAREGRALAMLAMPGDPRAARGLLFGPRVLRVHAPMLVALVVLVAVALPVAYVVGRSLPTGEGWGFDVVVMGLGALVLLGGVLGLVRLLAHWRSARRMFVALASHPVGEAIKDLPEPLFASVAALLAGAPLDPGAAAAEAQLEAELDRHRAARAGEDGPAARLEAALARLGDAAPPVERTAATRYLALAAVRVVRRVLAQIATDFAYLAGSFFCLLGAATLYPFQPRRLLFFVVTTFTLAGAGTLLMVILQIERDAVISRVTKTLEGKIHWSGSLFARLAAYGALPLFALASAQVPELARLFGVLGSIVARAMP